MSTRSRTALASLAFAALSALSITSASCALAQTTEPPGRVGRVALIQGRVDIAANPGDDAGAAQVNWPVTTGSTVVTAVGARTELRIGSTAVRLDGDSSLEVLALDDDVLQLRLHYGSASVRVVNPDTLGGFVLEVPQARVRLQQPGRMRVDAGRTTSAVTVFEGSAAVEGGGSQLTVRAGRRAEVGDEDVRTLAASRDAFDDWAVQRDRSQEAPTAARYVGTEMTGYEDLDRHGSWRVDDDYGALWTPNVASDWVPYRDGSWTWLEPWGWTWVDNAPWGYAPFHYGRWLYVRNRWCWAPGGRYERPVWAPALVGWVGGAGWNLTFRDRGTRPALGWYPLSPWDRFEPAYYAREDRLRWLNGYARPQARPRNYRPHGLTVLPQDRFTQPGRVDVPRRPIATVPPVLVRDLPAAAPPMPVQPPSAVPRQPRLGLPGRPWAGRTGDGRDGSDGGDGGIDTARVEQNGFGRDGRDGRIDTARVEQDGFVRGGRIGRQRPQPAPQQQQPTTAPEPGLVPPAAPVQPLPVTSPTPRQPTQPLPVTSPTPQPWQGQPVMQAPPPAAQPPQGWPGRPGRDHDVRDRDQDGRDRDWRGRNSDPGEWRRNRQPQPVAQAQPLPQAPAMAPAAAPAPVARPAPQPIVTAPPPRPLPPPVISPPPPRPLPQPVATAPAPAVVRSDGSRPEGGRAAPVHVRGQRQVER